jgi:hypothetical protein
VEFVVDEVALRQVFSEFFSFPCHFLFRRLLHTHHRLLPRAGTIGQLVADVPNGLDLTSQHKKKMPKDVAEEHVHSIFRFRVSQARNHPEADRKFGLILNLKMEATCSSETPIDFQRNTRNYIPEDRTIHYYLKKVKLSL